MTEEITPEIAELVEKIIQTWPAHWVDKDDIVVNAHISKLIQLDFGLAFPEEALAVKKLESILGRQRFIYSLYGLLTSELDKQRSSRLLALEKDRKQKTAQRLERLRILREQEEIERQKAEAEEIIRKEQQRLREEQEARERAIAEAKEQARLEAIRDFEDEIRFTFSDLLNKKFLSAETDIKMRVQTFPEGYEESQFLALISSEKLNFVRNWFLKYVNSGKLKQIPDTDQISAIAALDSHQLIKARAGSGKTATLVNAAVFLIEHCQINPSQILMLAFNRKAAGEIGERIFKTLHSDILNELEKVESKSSWKSRELVVERHKAIERIIQGLQRQIPNAMTFHALAYRILNTKLNLKMDEKGEYERPELSLEFHRVIEDMKQDAATLGKIRRVLECHFRSDLSNLNMESEWKKTDYAGRQRLLRFLQNSRKRTLRGDYVRSQAERWIADYLFLHGHDYKYEFNEQWNGNSTYRPDFVVSFPEDRQLLIEYFGLTDDADYQNQSQRKIEHLEKISKINPNKRNLFIYPNDFDQTYDGCKEYLDSVFMEFGLYLPERDTEEVWNQMKEEWLSQFDEAVTGFVLRAKSQALNPTDIMNLLSDHEPLNAAENEFLELAIEAFQKYESRMNEIGATDFANVLMGAAEKISQGVSTIHWERGSLDLSRLQYVFVDEFQDFSPLFDILMKEIRTQASDSIFVCVGDDWQAINGWAGASTTYFDNFQKVFTPARTNILRTNYRSGSSVVGMGNHVMAGKGEPASVPATRKSSIRWALIDELEVLDSEKEVFEWDKFLVALLKIVKQVTNIDESITNPPSIVLLSHKDRIRVARPNGRSKLEEIASDLKKHLSEDLRKIIRHSTIHSFKGNEGDVVIMLDVLQSDYPFIHPNWNLNRILGDSLPSIVDAESRLLYVAVTRAKTDLILLSSNWNQPDWLKEYPAEKIDWRILPSAVSDTSEAHFLIEVTGDTHPNKEILKASPFWFKWKAEKRCWWKNHSCKHNEIEAFLEAISRSLPASGNSKLEVSVQAIPDGDIRKFKLHGGTVQELDTRPF